MYSILLLFSANHSLSWCARVNIHPHSIELTSDSSIVLGTVAGSKAKNRAEGFQATSSARPRPITPALITEGHQKPYRSYPKTQKLFSERTQLKSSYRYTLGKVV
jgi:hypothetical protein